MRAVKRSLFYTRGFTIVELLIVIVVIGILAAITIVSFNGVQNKAYDTSVKSDLQALKKKLELNKIDNNDLYPGRPGDTVLNQLAAMGFQASKGSYKVAPSTIGNLFYCFKNANGGTFGLIAQSKSGKVFSITNTGSVTESSVSWTEDFGALCTSVLPGYDDITRGYASDDTTLGPWRAWTGK